VAPLSKKKCNEAIHQVMRVDLGAVCALRAGVLIYRNRAGAGMGGACGPGASPACVCIVHVMCVCEWGHSMLHMHSVCAGMQAYAGQRCF
jgi:hypothetical protein